jgi:hypothetical protein
MIASTASNVHWLSALEEIVADKDIGSPQELMCYQHAWATPLHARHTDGQSNWNKRI